MRWPSAWPRCARTARSAGPPAGRQKRRSPSNTTRTGKPVRVDTVVVSTQHTEAISENELRTAIIDEVISRALPADMLDQNTHIYVNPTGRFLIGGPAGDSGLTGRKLIVDTYGGYAHHGGGAFSGKDSSKVDRSAAYMARYIAKNVVAAGLADRGQAAALLTPSAWPSRFLCWSIPSARKKLPAKRFRQPVSAVDMRPAAIIKRFDLRTPNFSKVSRSRPLRRERQRYAVGENRSGGELEERVIRMTPLHSPTEKSRGSWISYRRKNIFYKAQASFDSSRGSFLAFIFTDC